MGGKSQATDVIWLSRYMLIHKCGGEGCLKNAIVVSNVGNIDRVMW